MFEGVSTTFEALCIMSLLILDLQELPSDYEEVDLPDFGDRNTNRDRDNHSSGNDSSSSNDSDDDNEQQKAGSGSVGDGGDSTMAGVITNIVEKGKPAFIVYKYSSCLPR